jgi:uncharacterized protein (DUF2147 family)
MKKTLFPIAAAILMSSASLVMADSPMGNWSRGDGNARVTIAKCGANICATNTWIKPGTPSEKKGDVLVMNVKPISDSQYSGSAFDPQRNMNYKMTISVNGSSMTSKGCVLAGLLCKGVSWTKID